jgi:hypothetical protein
MVGRLDLSIVDLHFADGAGVCERRKAHDLIGNSDQRPSQIGREVIRKSSGGGFKKTDGAVGSLHDEAPPGKFDLRLGDLEHRGHRREHGGFCQSLTTLGPPRPTNPVIPRVTQVTEWPGVCAMAKV